MSERPAGASLPRLASLALAALLLALLVAPRALAQSSASMYSAAGMPGSYGIAGYDALQTFCTGERDPAYRSEMERLARASLSERMTASVMQRYDDQYDRLWQLTQDRQQSRGDACSEAAIRQATTGGNMMWLRDAALIGHPKFARGTAPSFGTAAAAPQAPAAPPAAPQAAQSGQAETARPAPTTDPAPQTAQPPTAPRAERQLMRHGPLEAFVAAEGWCAPDVAVTVRTDDVFQFGGDRLELQRLVGQLRALVPFECPAMQRLLITGEAGGRIAFTGIADEAQGGVLEAQPLPETANAATPLPATPVTAAAPPAQPVSTLAAPDPRAPAENRNRAMVRETQRLLNAQGFDAGPVDGAFGRRTRAAIEAFERAQGFPVRGDVTRPLMAALAATQSGEHAEVADPATAPAEASGTSGAPATPLPPAARDLGLKMARGLPVLGGGRSTLTEAELQAASRFLDFVALGIDPDRLEAGAACWARRFLPEAEARRYLILGPEAVRESGMIHLGGEFVAWRGANEFEKERSRQAFIDEQGPGLRARAIDLPVEFLVVVERQLQTYDAAAGGYDLRLANLNRYGVSFRNLQSYTGVGRLPRLSCRGAGDFTSSGGDFLFSPPAEKLPELWPMDQARAEELLGVLDARKIYVAIGLQLQPAADARRADTPRSSPRPHAWGSISSVAVYADPDLERLIEEMPLRSATAPVLLSGQSEAAPADGVPSPAAAEATAPEVVAFHKHALAMLLLREHGDVLDAAAWQRLARYRAEQDALYYERRRDPWTGERLSGEPTAELEAGYVPFFPRGHRLAAQQGLTAEEERVFRDWSMAQAASLPGRMVYRGRLVRQRDDGRTRLDLGVALERNEAVLEPLLARGLVPGQLRDITFQLTVGDTSDPLPNAFIAAPGKSRRAVLVLPNLLDSYIPDWSDEDWRRIFGENWRAAWASLTADVTLEVTGTELVPLDDRTELFLVQATPQAIRVLDRQGDAVLLDERYDVAALEPGEAVAAELAIAVPDAALLPFTAETADLLVARFQPDQLDDIALARMLLARWAYEAAHDGRNGEPDWGRFFVEGAPKPAATELATLAPRFRDWTLARAQAMPTTITLDMGTVRPGQPGPIHLGAGAPDQSLRQLARSCTRRVPTIQRQGEPVRARTLENACTFLDAALAIVPREVLLSRPGSDPRQVIRQLAQTAGRNLPHPSGLPRQSGDLVVGPRVHCGLTSAGQDAYCRAGLAALDDELLGQPTRLNDVLVLDQEVVLPDSPEISRLSSPKLALDLEVTGIRLADELAPHPFGTAYRDYQAFLARVGLRQQDQQRDLDQALPLAHFLIDARIEEARLIDARSGETVATLPLQDPRTLDRGLLAEAEFEAVPLPEEPFGPAVVGLRLGMTFAAAEAIIQEHMEVGRMLVADRTSAAGGTVPDPAPYTSGRLYESADGTDVIILYDEPPSAPEVVLGIVRQLALPKGVVAPGQIDSQLEQRYGSPTARERGNAIWLDEPADRNNTSSVCVPRANAEAAITMWHGQGDDTAEWNPPTAIGQGSRRFLPGMGIDNAALAAVADPSQCRTTLTATFSTDRHPDWDSLVLRLLDERLYGEHFAASRHMLEQGQGASGTAEPDEPAIEIRL